MAKEYVLMSALNGGEWSPRLIGQIGLKKYREACSILENWIVYPHGPAHTRPGFIYVVNAKYQTKNFKLLPFIYSNLAAYMLEWGDLYIRFIKDQAQIMDPNSGLPLEIVTPYVEEDIPYIQTAQSFDVSYVVQRNYPPRKLDRYSDTDWRIPVVSLPDGPYRNANADGVTYIQPSAVSGNGVTLTATARSVAQDIGTFDGTPTTPQAAFTSSLPYVGFAFTTSSALQLNSATLYVAAAPGTAISVTASVYANNPTGNHPTGSALDTAPAVTVDDVGGFTWNFTSIPTLTTATIYWIVFHATTTDSAITLDAVTLDTDYLSGGDTTLGAVGNTMTASWSVDLSITPAPAVPTVFYPEHVGALWRLRHEGASSRGWFNTVGHTTTPLLLRGKFTVNMTPYIPSSGNSYWDGEIILQSGNDLQNWMDAASFFYSTKQEFVESKSNVYYRLWCKSHSNGGATCTISQSEHWGTLKITQYVSGSQVIGNVLFPFGAVTPTSDWREGEFSNYRGYPETVAFHDDRLYFARDVTLWASWVGDYENFNPDGDTDDAAITFSPTQIENSIVWMESIKGLMVGSLGEEGQITGSNEKPISQSAIKCEVQTSVGSAQYPTPIKVGQAALYVSLDRRKILEFVYDLSKDSFKAPDLSVRAEHITAGGIFDTCYQQNPNSIVWAVRADGVLLGLTYYREEDVVAWSRTTTQGLFVTCAEKPSSLGILEGYDELWVGVQRLVGGEYQSMIEVMANHEPTNSETRDATDFCCLDCSLVFAPGHQHPPSKRATITGLGYLEGAEVTVVGDGIKMGTFTVSGGQITLPNSVYLAYVGLPYTCTLGTLPLEITDRSGPSVGRTKQSYELIIRLLESLGGKYGSSLDSLTDIPYRTPQDLIGQQLPLFTGPKILTYSSTAIDNYVYIVQDEPFPLTVVSISVPVTVGD